MIEHNMNFRFSPSETQLLSSITLGHAFTLGYERNGYGFWSTHLERFSFIIFSSGP